MFAVFRESMNGPTYSDDGQWMWNGNGWIPAPPTSQVLPQSALNQDQIYDAANNANISPQSLENVAPYFDNNADGVLQQNELQQAVNYVSNPVPNMPYPQQDVTTFQNPASPQDMTTFQSAMPNQDMTTFHTPMVQQSNYYPQQNTPVQQSNHFPTQNNPAQRIAISTSKKAKSGGSGSMAFAIILLVMILVGASAATYLMASDLAESSTDDDDLAEKIAEDIADEVSSDLDSDGVENYYDSCSNGETGWTSTSSTDWDGDGCRDSTEDSDDDGDGVSDYYDDCSKGTKGWTSTSSTDFDDDGCKDSGEDTDDDNDGYSDSNDWYDRGNGAISLRLTRFTAWSGGYYDGDGSNPDVYAYIGVDYSCSGTPDWTYYEYSEHTNSYDLDNWLYVIYDFAETADTVCIKVEVWDNDGATYDDQLDYVSGSGDAYYWTIDLDSGGGTFSKSYDNRGENDVSIALDLEFNRIAK